MRQVVFSVALAAATVALWRCGRDAPKKNASVASPSGEPGSPTAAPVTAQPAAPEPPGPGSAADDPTEPLPEPSFVEGAENEVGVEEAAPPSAPSTVKTEIAGVKAAVALEPCANPTGQLCLVVVVGADRRTLALGPGTRRRTAATYGVDLVAIGDHAGSATAELAALYQTRPQDDDAVTVPTLAVVDPEAMRIVWTTSGPPSGRAGQVRLSFSDVLRRQADGRAYPYLAPGLEDLPQSKLTASSVIGTARSLRSWGYLCMLAPAARPAGRCGEGFAEVLTAPSDTEYGKAFDGAWGREFGAFALDADSDGHEDLHLIFKGGIQVISGKSAAPLYTIPIDVAKDFRATHDLDPGFDSFRLRGIVSGFTASTGGRRALLVSGLPVGSFNDHTCAVTRFVALIGMSATGGLAKWRDYYGFATATFESFVAADADKGDDFIAQRHMRRAGDVANNCIHYFDDARAESSGAEIALVNYFRDADAKPKCVSQAYKAQLPGRTAADYDTYYKCLLASMCDARGTWKVKGYDMATGDQLIGGSNVYVWGWTTKLRPASPKTIYVVETLTPDGAGSTPYDFGGRMNVTRFGGSCVHSAAPPAQPLRLMTLEGAFVHVAALPPGARPVIEGERPSGARGSGSGTTYPALVTRAGSLAGAVDIKLDNGKWFGLAADGMTWAEKP